MFTSGYAWMMECEIGGNGCVFLELRSINTQLSLKTTMKDGITCPAYGTFAPKGSTPGSQSLARRDFRKAPGTAEPRRTSHPVHILPNSPAFSRHSHPLVPSVQKRLRRIHFLPSTLCKGRFRVHFGAPNGLQSPLDGSALNRGLLALFTVAIRRIM